jgi:hypothetical protein
MPPGKASAVDGFRAIPLIWVIVFPIENVLFSRRTVVSAAAVLRVLAGNFRLAGGPVAKVVCALALVSLLALLFPAPSAAQNTRFFPVDDLRVGMKGVGRTVFQGTTIEDFQVEILGILKNVQPKQDVILARLSGGPLDKTGVIQGMSGSPVYIEGRLVGAVAFAFPFAKEPIAGIQPIAQMLGILDQPPAAPGRAAVDPSEIAPAVTPAAFVFGMMERARNGLPLREILGYPPAPSVPGGASLSRIQTPLSVSGLTPAAAEQFAAFFAPHGFTVVQSGGAGSAATLPSVPPRRLEPGAAVNAQLVQGDIDISANGTVTYVDGDKVYAFGHPFLSAGPLDLPMSSAYVISSLARLDVSNKVAVPVDVVGAFRQDRSTGILGTMAERPATIPVAVTVRSSTNTTNRYRFNVVNDRYLTPLLMNLTLLNAITATERGLGEMTLNVSGRVNLRNNEPIQISNISTADANGPSMASLAAVAPIQYLLNTGFEGALIESVDLEILSVDRKTSATLEQISVDKTEVRPGEAITLWAHLRGTRGEVLVEQYSVQIPAGLRPGSVQLMVGDGGTVTASELRRGSTGAPPGLNAAVRELNKLRKNDRLYVRILSNEPGAVIRGEALPSLPPSTLSVLDTERASNRGIAPLSNSTVSEYELPQSRYVLQGQRALTITVKS